MSSIIGMGQYKMKDSCPSNLLLKNPQNGVFEDPLLEDKKEAYEKYEISI